jgi:hypothetical protein
MKTFQFKIELTYTGNPVVWRRLLVPEDICFDDFHLAIQAAFGWDFSHLYQFSAKGWGSKPYYQPLGEWAEDDDEMRDSEEYLISEVFKRAGQKYTYIYDFGDDWKHQILLEKTTGKPVFAPHCIGGEGACPPEDCGGVHGYYRMVDAINNPNHKDHEEMLEWMGIPEGGKWDVNAFDLDQANARCASLVGDDEEEG